jgi:hypothetical protein
MYMTQHTRNLLLECHFLIFYQYIKVREKTITSTVPRNYGLLNHKGFEITYFTCNFLKKSSLVVSKDMTKEMMVKVSASLHPFVLYLPFCPPSNRPHSHVPARAAAPFLAQPTQQCSARFPPRLPAAARGNGGRGSEKQERPENQEGHSIRCTGALYTPRGGG